MALQCEGCTQTHARSTCAGRIGGMRVCNVTTRAHTLGPACLHMPRRSMLQLPVTATGCDCEAGLDSVYARVPSFSLDVYVHTRTHAPLGHVQVEDLVEQVHAVRAQHHAVLTDEWVIVPALAVLLPPHLGGTAGGQQQHDVSMQHTCTMQWLGLRPAQAHSTAFGCRMKHKQNNASALLAASSAHTQELCHSVLYTRASTSCAPAPTRVCAR